ncbi:MAG: gfo/Idh/MocA family oxidoreductase [Phycisphaera sp.]|nr:gfo/Idh/MocA family oxidoreductase [Phycisphaera sp.]
MGLTAAALTARRARADKPRIRIGQIGTGHAHAAGKLSTIRKFADDYELVGVVEPDAGRAAAMSTRKPYDGVPFITEEQLFNTKGLQAVAVETDVAQLVPTAQRCIDAGFPIHLDKPAGSTLPPTVALHESAQHRKLIIQMGYMLRYNPAFTFMMQALRDGWIGEPFELHAVMSKAVGDGSRKELAAFPGGSMFELGCHLIDSAVYAMGKPDAVTPYVHNTQPQKDTLADNCLAVFDYAKASATIRSSLVEVEGFKRRQFTICGDHGTIDVRPLESGVVQLALDKPRGDYKKGYQEVKFKTGGRYDGDFTDLAAVLRGEKDYAWSHDHDIAVHETLLRASAMPLT